MDKCQYPRAFTVGQEGIQIMDFMKVLYIDPGTGGMLFTVLFGLFGVVVFSMRALAMRLKFSVGSDKNAKINNKKIPIAIFAESKRYWNTFAPILDEFEKRKKNVVYLTCSEDDPVFKKKYEYVSAEFIGEGNKAFSRLNLLNASVVLSTTPYSSGNAQRMWISTSISRTCPTTSLSTECSVSTISTLLSYPVNIRRSRSESLRKNAE